MQLNEILNEISRASTMKAAIALSKFLQVPVGINIGPVEIKRIEDIHMLANPEQATVSLYLPIKEKLIGSSFFLYSQQSALAICDILFNREEGSTKKLTDMEISALSEIGNVVLGNFLSSFAQSLQIDPLMHNPATFQRGSLAMISEQILAALSQKMGQVIVIKISFGFQHGKTIKGNVIIVFEKDKINRILKQMSLVQ